MKLEPVFTVKNNVLYKIEDNSVVDISKLKMVEILWSTVELEEESYNEEFLAQLREELKVLENTKNFVILVPVADKPLETPEQFELFTNAFNHTARRIKDCASVAGFKLPAQMAKKGFCAESPAACFMETIAIKHAQYVTFADKTDVTDCSGTEDSVVLL